MAVQVTALVVADAIADMVGAYGCAGCDGTVSFLFTEAAALRSEAKFASSATFLFRIRVERDTHPEHVKQLNWMGSFDNDEGIDLLRDSPSVKRPQAKKLINDPHRTQSG